MAKKERNKKAADKYVSQGRLQMNKLEKQEKAKRRLERIQRRAERRKVRQTDEEKPVKTVVSSEVKEYNYLPVNKKGKKIASIEKRRTMYSVNDNRSYGWWQSIFAKLKNERVKLENELKLKRQKRQNDAEDGDE